MSMRCRLDQIYLLVVSHLPPDTEVTVRRSGIVLRDRGS